MTLDGLAQEMATEFGEQYGDLDIADQFKKWTQQAYEEVVANARWLFRNNRVAVTLVAGTSVYTLAATVSQIRAAYLSNAGQTLQQTVAYCTVERLRARGEALGETGTPLAWFYSGWDSATHAMKVQVWPVPDASAVATWPTMYLDVVERPLTLVASDTIPLPVEYLNVIRDCVRYHVKMNDGDVEQARAFRTLYSDGIAQLNQQYLGAEEGGSSLRIKRLHANRQSPATSQEG
jgi:hypothetical protein